MRTLLTGMHRYTPSPKGGVCIGDAPAQSAGLVARAGGGKSVPTVA